MTETPIEDKHVHKRCKSKNGWKSDVIFHLSAEKRGQLDVTTVVRNITFTSLLGLPDHTVVSHRANASTHSDLVGHGMASSRTPHETGDRSSFRRGYSSTVWYTLGQNLVPPRFPAFAF